MSNPFSIKSVISLSKFDQVDAAKGPVVLVPSRPRAASKGLTQGETVGSNPYAHSSGS